MIPLAQLRDRLLLWLLMGSASYPVGPFTVTAQTPVIVQQSASAGTFCWFSWLANHGFGQLSARWFDGADSIGDPTSHDRHLVSSDSGATWTLLQPGYASPGGDGPWAQVPVMVSDPGIKNPWSSGAAATTGKVIGAGYELFRVNATTLSGAYVEMQNGGRDFYRAVGRITVSSMPRDVTADGANPGHYLSRWYGDIIQITAARWLSSFYIQFSGDTKYSCVCVESTDQGKTWTYVGTPFPAASIGSTEGADESSLLDLGGGNILAVARVGSWSASTQLARASSSDYGRTWGAIDRIPPARVAPRLFRLSGTGDVACLSGETHGNPPAALGAWLTTNPLGNTWDKFDILAHHNAMISDPLLQFPLPSGGCTAYMGVVELAPNRLLVSYDRARGSYGLDSSVNTVFVVDFTITR